MQDVIHHILSANPPEAGVLSGLVRPERQAGTVTAIKRKMPEGLSAGAAEATPTLRVHRRMACLLWVHHYSPGNSRRERGWTRVAACRLWGTLQGAGARSAFTMYDVRAGVTLGLVDLSLSLLILFNNK